LFSCAHLNADLVWWYDLEEGDGTTAEDEQGNNDGTLNGAVWIEPGAPTSPDYAIAYTNLSAYLDLGYGDWTSGGSNATIALWIHWNGVGPNRTGNLNHLIRKYLSWNYPAGGMFVWEADIAGMHRINLTGGNRVIFNTPLPSGEWAHVAVVVDGSSGTVTGYLNGDPDGSGNFRFGNKRDDLIMVGGSADKTFNGAMDDIRFYDHLLTEEEIKTLAIPEPAAVMLLVQIICVLKNSFYK
jgi:hypothetical protein